VFVWVCIIYTDLLKEQRRIINVSQSIYAPELDRVPAVKKLRYRKEKIMSLYFYSGKPGSGKSLHAARVIDQWVRQGKNVITNFPINENFWDRRREKGKKTGIVMSETNDFILRFGIRGLVGFARQFHKLNSDGEMIERQTLVIFDECQTLFNSRSWNIKGRSDWISMFTQHRKFGYEFILISQDKALIDKQIRLVFQYDYEHRNLKFYKTFGFLLSFILGGNFFVIVVKSMDVGKKDHSEFKIGQKKYYKLYDSYRIFDTATLRANY
jgi:zona occludens toxin